MVSESSAENPQETAGGLVAVGARLSSARKKQQINLDAIADELHLRLEVLQALEAGDEAGLPSPAFTRGYVRSYARLVGVEADELLAQLPASGEYQLTPVGRAPGPSHGARPQLGKLLLWLLVLGGLAGLVLYGVPVVERLMNALPVEPDSGRLELPRANEDPSSMMEEEVIIPLPVAVVVETESGPVPDEAGVVLVEETADPAPGGEVAPLQEAIVVQKEPTAEVIVPELLLRFSQDSWVEIDAGGRRLLAGVQPAGSERSLNVAPPIHVLLGNAPGVELIYNGEVVNTASYRKGKVARLTLEQN